MIELADGRRAVVKGGPAPSVEAAMLEAMAATGAPAPAVLGVDAATLVLECLSAGRPSGRAWGDLGGALRKLHAATGARFGWDADYAFGPVVIANACCDDWPEFWSERRIANQLDYLPRDLRERLCALARDLPNRLPARPSPSLLHGDLWGGNILFADGRVSGLIDPACYYGDREVDFAMLHLFNRPADAIHAEYGALDAGHRERRPIYQLWPAIVHLRLFGGAYRPMVEGLLARLGC